MTYLSGLIAIAMLLGLARLLGLALLTLFGKAEKDITP